MEHLVRYEPEIYHHRAAWVVERCRGAANCSLQQVVPSGFDAYVRLCQPGWRWPALDPDDKAAWAELAAGRVDYRQATPVRWCDAAEESGREAHRLMQWYAIAPSEQEPGTGGISAPLEYELTRDMVEILLDVLIRHSGRDQECICAFWEGYGRLDFLRQAGNTRIEGIGQQGYFLFNATLSAIRDQWWVALMHSHETGGLVPNALWPTSQDWYLAVPIGPTTPYFGGPFDLVSDIRRAPGLETYEAFLDDDIWHDPINSR